MFKFFSKAPAPKPAAPKPPVPEEWGPRDVPDYLERTRHKLFDLRKIPIFGKQAEKAISEAYTNHYYDRLLTVFEGLVNVQRRVKGRPPVLAEVGVFRGGSAKFSAAVLHDLGITDFQFHLFDTFEGHASEDIDASFDRVDVHSPGLFGNTSLEGVKQTLGDVQGFEFHKGRFADTCGAVEQVAFDYVHLDVDLYLPLVHALDFFAERLNPGGWLIVDDYGFLTCPGAKKAVEEFLAKNANFTALTLLSGQSLLIRI